MDIVYSLGILTVLVILGVIIGAMCIKRNKHTKIERWNHI